MKKLLFTLSAIALLFCACDPNDQPDDPIVNDSNNQEEPTSITEFVSTLPTNRIAVIEEFTGNQCVYCPDGHAIANSICQQNPGKVIPINIHFGAFANKYTTPNGNTLGNYFEPTGFPIGMVNRHAFSGSQVLYDRGSWSAYVNQIINEPSCVNVAAYHTIDKDTRQMQIEVEGYYTANSDVETNRLSVFLLQDSVIGPQTGGANFNPSQVMPNGQYCHMHMFRKSLASSVWGDTIFSTTQGSIFRKSYTYKVPSSISSVDANLNNLHVVVMVARNRKDIITACNSELR